MRANCNKIKSEANHSIDEQIIPAKTKKSGGVRQYNPKKPHKWGFKNLVRAGIIYDFFLYSGKIVRQNTTKSGVQNLFWQLVFYIRFNGPA